MTKNEEAGLSDEQGARFKIKWSRIIIGCLLGLSFAVALGFLRFFNAADQKDMGIAFGLSVAEFVVCLAIAIFVEHRRLARLRWRAQAVQFEKRRNVVAEAETWTTETQKDLETVEREIEDFKTDVHLRIRGAASLDELKKVARQVVMDGYNSGIADVRGAEIKGEAK